MNLEVLEYLLENESYIEDIAKDTKVDSGASSESFSYSWLTMAILECSKVSKYTTMRTSSNLC